MNTITQATPSQTRPPTCELNVNIVIGSDNIDRCYAGILVIRIWYLFQGSKTAQVGIIFGFLISVVLSLVFLYLSANNDKLHIIPIPLIGELFPGIRNEGCKAARPPDFWRIYLPSLILHRLTLTPSKPSFLLTTTSVAVTRVLFSIHSLADKLGSSSAWLLNNVELSRVGWRKGERDGEIVVEKIAVYADDIESAQTLRSNSKNSMIKETRVGFSMVALYGLGMLSDLKLKQ
ncbi:hypothetical protein H0H93_001565 [Arthromyces matolae]|nr:hypothetical protein H0H93_001565 [Arthromyces matolae]